jgi:hypothetical protein
MGRKSKITRNPKAFEWFFIAILFIPSIVSFFLTILLCCGVFSNPIVASAIYILITVFVGLSLFSGAIFLMANGINALVNCISSYKNKEKSSLINNSYFERLDASPDIACGKKGFRTPIQKLINEQGDGFNKTSLFEERKRIKEKENKDEGSDENSTIIIVEYKIGQTVIPSDVDNKINLS